LGLSLALHCLYRPRAACSCRHGCLRQATPAASLFFSSWISSPNLLTLRSRLSHLITVYFFFFQAEDGIRDATVTGVQTCALPICMRREMKHLTPHTGDVENDPQTFDVNSKYLYFLSNEGGEFKYIARYDLKTGQREAVEKAPWDVSLMAFSRNGKYRVVATNEDAHTKIKILEEASGQMVDLRSLPEGDISGINISDTETKMAFYHDGSRAPANLYVYDFKPKKLAKF